MSGRDFTRVTYIFDACRVAEGLEREFVGIRWQHDGMRARECADSQHAQLVRSQMFGQVISERNTVDVAFKTINMFIFMLIFWYKLEILTNLLPI